MNTCEMRVLNGPHDVKIDLGISLMLLLLLLCDLLDSLLTTRPATPAGSVTPRLQGSLGTIERTYIF
jgi:hypothetical protein